MHIERTHPAPAPSGVIPPNTPSSPERGVIRPSRGPFLGVCPPHMGEEGVLGEITPDGAGRGTYYVMFKM